MSIPRQIRTLLKLAAFAALLAAVAAGIWAESLRRRGQRAQALYDSVAIGDPWQGLAGFAERRVVSDPDSRVPAPRLYRHRVAFFLPICWEIVVDEDGRVTGKHRYD